MNFLEGEVNTKTERIDNLETEYKMTKEEFIKRHEKVVAHNKKLEAEANQNATQIVELEDGKKFLKEELITHKEAIRVGFDIDIIHILLWPF
jgi:chromosome segregation ATPase